MRTYNDMVIEKALDFGAMLVMESMANMIEKHLYPQKKYGYQVQYDICELLAKYVTDEFAIKSGNIAALCDASLMYDNPGMVFYATLTLIAKEKFVPQNINEVYEFVFSRYEPQHSSIYNKYYLYCIESINKVIPQNNPHYLKLNRYVVSAFESCKQKRQNENDFITKIFELPPVEGKSYLCKVMNDLEMPLIIDNNNQTYSTMEDTGSEANMLLVPALFSMFLLMSSDNTCVVCDMINICSAQYKKMLILDVVMSHGKK